MLPASRPPLNPTQRRIIGKARQEASKLAPSLMSHHERAAAAPSTWSQPGICRWSRTNVIEQVAYGKHLKEQVKALWIPARLARAQEASFTLSLRALSSTSVLTLPGAVDKRAADRAIRSAALLELGWIIKVDETRLRAAQMTPSSQRIRIRINRPPRPIYMFVPPVSCWC